MDIYPLAPQKTETNNKQSHNYAGMTETADCPAVSILSFSPLEIDNPPPPPGIYHMVTQLNTKQSDSNKLKFHFSYLTVQKHVAISRRIPTSIWPHDWDVNESHVCCFWLTSSKKMLIQDRRNQVLDALLGQTLTCFWAVKRNKILACLSHSIFASLCYSS